MNSLSPEVTLSRISPELRPLLCSVVRNGRVGLDSSSCLRITDLKSGCTSLMPGPCCDRFKLHIPYAGETLKWDIIFNAKDPELPPDFIFGEDADFLPEPSELPHLVSWDAGKPECLLQLVKELLQQYHQYQCQRLRDSSRLLFEYDSLLDDPNYGRSMEIYAGLKNSWTGEFSARFLLKLPVDFSNIPIYLLKDTALDPGEDVALLSVSFEDAEATQVFPKLYLSPSIEQGVVEYDAVGFTKLTLLLMWKDFCFLVHVDLPLYFPRDQPTLTFQSIYHFTSSGQLYSQVQKSYPYSPRWDGNEMAKRAKAYFKSFIPQFQEGAFANGKL
uniref:BRISC and BRCA1-A complex member 2 n=1 Tax=Cyprinus carpio carpio TaxID=630221 RepID=A0A9J8BRW2_CYPCA